MPEPDTALPTSPLVGVVPAAGSGTRLGRLPFSKELFPTGGHHGNGQARVVAHGLLRQLRDAAAEPVYIVVRSEKWDIPTFLGSGTDLGVDLAYLVVDTTRSVVESIDRAYPYMRGRRVALGFPDVLLDPPDALAAIARCHEESAADLVLGLFPTARPDKSDMVATDPGGRVLRVEVKPEASDLDLTWMLAVWGPRFTELLHQSAAAAPTEPELQPGHVVQRALDEGFDVRSVSFRDGGSIDLGTPEDLARAAAAGFRVEPGGRAR